ncbi:AraC-type DNA-binding protein [Gracilimonas mengyeensis]|uniref:AraC-type DNA-binding protein n=2 Tax=Gracilimonas mengyeensis TaxID=1302730 RepID=A0A521CXN3_9BACT|nr:AraC-type DNA-binding protein [Gracilimonas mengyeensis]
MVCSHCGEVLREKLQQAGFTVEKVELGEVHLAEPINTDQQDRFAKLVRENGFDVINDQNSRLVEQIKQLIIQLVRTSEKLEGPLSDYLAQKVHRDYQQLSRLFSSVEGKSIERYYILQKIERAKELIVYGEMNLSEIAYELDYSSQQHFSRQFKKETGLSPSHFSEIKENRRISIDEV